MPKNKAALLGALALLAILPASAPPALHAARAVIPVPVVPGPPLGAPEPDPELTPAPGTGRCGDQTGTWLGMRWREPLQWRINVSTIPPYFEDSAGVVNALQNAAINVDSGRNDCNLPADLGEQQRYLGSTDKIAGVTQTGGCGDRDGVNAVSFGRLNAGLLAVTCIWWLDDKDGGHSVETDILIDDTPGLFFLDATAGCQGRWDLEGTITHEFGHAFGLGHVAYAEHGDLTMTDGLPDCSTAYRGLGLGDYLTLKRQYGP